MVDMLFQCFIPPLAPGKRTPCFTNTLPPLMIFSPQSCPVLRFFDRLSQMQKLKFSQKIKIGGEENDGAIFFHAWLLPITPIFFRR